MPGIAEGIPGARAFDEVLEQNALVQRRNLNNGKPPASQIVLESQTTSEFRSSVLGALGVGSIIGQEA